MYRLALMRVVRLLQRWRGSAARVDDGRGLSRARAGAIKWKDRATALSGRARQTAAEMTELRGQLEAAHDRAATLHREVPSVALVQQTFTYRAKTLAARVALPASAQREAHLLARSDAYRRVVGGELPRGPIHRMEAHGLTWWLPGRGARTHTPEEMRLPFRTILQTREVATGGIMLDLGANVGRMAIPRLILGDVTAAYCAEPDPVTFACLARNVIDNGLRGLVLPDQTAIGDRDGTVPLLRAGASGNFRVLPAASANQGQRTVEVPCCRLDTWVDRLEVDLAAVTFIKVDVEGFERRVLAGAARVLACRHIAWQMEIKPAGLRDAGDDASALYADLQQWFTHFIDLNRQATGKRIRTIAELAAALQYIAPDRKTDVLLFSH